MTRRLPPSQRDRRSLDAAVRQVSRGLTSLAGPGFLGGRLALPQALPGGLDSYSEAADDDGGGAETLEFQWWDRDKYHLTSTDVTRGYAICPLTWTPVERSLQLSWIGLYQPSTSYAVDYDMAQVYVPLGGFEQPNDLLSFHYQYIDDVEPVDPTDPLTLLVLRGVTDVTGVRSTVPMPGAAEVGDVVVVMGHGPNDGGKDQLLPGGAMTDSRLTGNYQGPSHDTWWGTLTSLEDIALTLANVDSRAIVAVFGDTGGHDVEVVEEQVDGQTRTSANYSVPISMAALTDRRGAIMCRVGDRGTASDTCGFTVGYTAAVPSVTATEFRIEYWTGDAPSPATNEGPFSDYQNYDTSLIRLPVRTVGGS